MTMHEIIGKYGRTLSNIRKSNHWPEGSSASIRNQLCVNGIGHMVQTSDDKWSIEGTKNRTEEPFNWTR